MKGCPPAGFTQARRTTGRRAGLRRRPYEEGEPRGARKTGGWGPAPVRKLRPYSGHVLGGAAVRWWRAVGGVGGAPVGGELVAEPGALAAGVLAGADGGALDGFGQG